MLLRLDHLRWCQFDREVDDAQESGFDERRHLRLGRRPLQQHPQLVEHVPIVRIAPGSVSLGQEVVVDERSEQTGTPHQNKQDGQGHHYDLREGDESQNVQGLEFDQRDEQARAPPRVLAHGLEKER
jgi:hypothetical protein